MAAALSAWRARGRSSWARASKAPGFNLYVLNNGIQWRAMPHDLPHRSTVYPYFRKWQKEGVWERVAQTLVRLDREREGRYASPSALAMDSQSVKTGKRGPRGRQPSGLPCRRGEEG